MKMLKVELLVLAAPYLVRKSDQTLRVANRDPNADGTEVDSGDLAFFRRGRRFHGRVVLTSSRNG